MVDNPNLLEGFVGWMGGARFGVGGLWVVGCGLWVVGFGSGSGFVEVEMFVLRVEEIRNVVLACAKGSVSLECGID